MSRSPLDFQESEKQFLFLLSIFKIWKKNSLSPLDFQDFWDQFLFLLSIFKILEKISLSPLDFQDFLNEYFYNWSLSMICQNMLVSLYLTTFTFTLLPDWFLTLSWHCTVSDKDCRKGKYLLELTCVWDSGSSFQAAMDRKMDSENSVIRISIISFCSQDWIIYI